MMNKIRILGLICLLSILSSCVKGTDYHPSQHEPLHMLTMDYGAIDVCSTRNSIYKVELGNDSKSSIIYYINETTKNEIPLCSRAECDHNDDTCTAYISDSTPYIFSSYNSNKLFIINNVYSDEGFVTSISSMDEDGHNRKEIYRLKNGESFAYPIMVAEYGNTFYIMKYCFEEDNMVETLVQIDYENCANIDILNFSSGSSIIGADSNKMYICSDEYTSDSQTLFTILDIEKNELNQVLIPDKNPHSYFCYGGDVYRVGGNEYFLLEKLTLDNINFETVYSNYEYNAKWSFDIVCIIDDNLIISYRDAENNLKRMVYNMLTNDIHDLTLKISGEDKREAYISVLGYTNKYYYVATNSAIRDFLYMTPNGTYENGKFTVLEKRFIDKQDYINNIPNYIV